MLLAPQQVLVQLKQKQYAPVYFLQGEEPYYIDSIADYIEENVLSTAEKSFNLTVVYGRDQTMSQILAQARRFPMGSTYQAVIVKEAQELQDLKREEGYRLLQAYIQSPQPATLLVFAHKYKVVDLKRPLGKLLEQKAVLVNSKKLYDNQIPVWIKAHIQEKGLSITEKATLMLQEFVGNDLSRLANELDKIRLNLAQSTEIDSNTVQTYVGISKKFNAFELQQALARKDACKAQQFVLYFEANSKDNPAIPLVASLFAFFSKLLLVHQSGQRLASSLAQVLQVNPYFVQEYLLAAQNYPLPKVIENIHYLHQADLQLKGIDYPSIAEGQILKELVFKLML